MEVKPSFGVPPPVAIPVSPSVPPRILISNGFNRFHLADLAAGLRRRRWDVELITGAYPVGAADVLLRAVPFRRSRLAARLRDRRVGIEPARVHADFVAEFVQRTGYVVASHRPLILGTAIEQTGFRIAALRAGRVIRKSRHVAAYHYRSGFGLKSVDAANGRGILTICDHSIVHPATLEPLVQNGGRLPADWKPTEPGGIWALVLRDLEQADWIVVNSTFVRETFRWAGFDTTRMTVIYLGVGPEFVQSIPERVTPSGAGRLRLLFVGEIGQRKGADVLFGALSKLRRVDWQLDLVGSITPAIAAGWTEFLDDSRVTWRGTVRRREVAALMSRADVFVFPSLAEGSARVIAEAMAAGCYVITTPNSGSIVQDGVHGRLVPPGDADILATVLQDVADHRTTVPSVGRANAEAINREYLMEHYAQRVDQFYREILGRGPLESLRL